MNDNYNPYTPPSTAVQDMHSKDPRARPRAVVGAVVLLVVNLLYSGYTVARLARWINTGFVAPAFFIRPLVSWIVIILACMYLWRGRNWARILLVMLTALSLLTMVRGIRASLYLPAGVDLPMTARAWIPLLVGPVVNLAAVFLVYLPGREWFRNRAA